MSEPREGMAYRVELDVAGEILTIEARQNGEKISSVDIARSAWAGVVRSVAEVERDHTRRCRCCGGYQGTSDDSTPQADTDAG